MNSIDRGVPTVFRDEAPNARMTYRRRLDRTTDELIGLCRGLVADGEVNKQEVLYLEGWLRSNREFRSEYPFSALFERVRDALEDGVIDPDEERDLLAAIHGLAGDTAPTYVAAVSTSSSLPLCRPAPEIVFPGVSFVITGTCSFGSRRDMVEAIAARGGTVASNISRKVGTLVVGDLCSRDWVHSSYGRKIQAAVELREAGHPISIVSENHWLAHL